MIIRNRFFSVRFQFHFLEKYQLFNPLMSYSFIDYLKHPQLSIIELYQQFIIPCSNLVILLCNHIKYIIMYKSHLLTYKNIEYILVWNKERLQIYGDQALDCIQSIKNLYSDIQFIVPTSTGGFYIITNKQCLYYSLFITKRIDLVWQKIASQSLDQQILNAHQCSNLNILVLFSENNLYCYQLNKKFESTFIKQMEFIKTWTINFKQKMLKMALSDDQKYLALNSSENRVLIWSLSKIPEIFNKGLKIDEFIQLNYEYCTQEKVMDIQFRRIMNSNYKVNQPNTIYLVTADEIKILQEVLFSENSINYVQIQTIKLFAINSLIQINFIREQHRHIQQNGDYYKNNNLQSVNTICIQKESNFLIFELYGLRQNRLNAGYNLIKKLNVPSLQNINDICYNNYKKNMTILGLSDNNVCRVLYNYKEDIQIQNKIINYQTKILEALYQKNSLNLVIRKEDGLYCHQLDQQTWLKPESEIRKIIKKLNIKPSSDKLIYYNNLLYFIEDRKFHVFNVLKNVMELSIDYDRTPKYYFLLTVIKSKLFIFMDGEIIKYYDKKLQVVKKLLPVAKVLKMEYNINNKSLLVKNPRFYMLYKILINDQTQTFQLKQVKKSLRHTIYGEGYWVEIYQNEIIFGKENNKVVTFNIVNFLGNISKQHNVSVLYFRIFHLTDQIFSLQIQNYIFFLNVFFDKKKQKFQINALKKNIHSQELLSIRLSKRSNPQSIEILSIDNIIIKSENKILFFGRYVNQIVTHDPFNYTQTVGFVINSVKRIVPMHHPKFLQELCLVAGFLQIETIFQILYLKILKQNTIEPYFGLKIHHFLKMFYSQKYDEKQIILDTVGIENYVPKDRVIIFKQLEQMVLQIDYSEDYNRISYLQTEQKDDANRVNLSKNNPLLLANLINFAKFRLENFRSLDYFSTIFISQTKNLWNSKNKTISTRQLCWILHSTNKQEAFNLLIEEPLQQKGESLTWCILKQYCAVTWYQNINHVKKWVQRIALAEYKKSQDPFDCLLWYILLNKKNILLALFKKCTDQIKTFEFLSRDFNAQNNKVAASKNAYALLSKKRYQHSIAFFILAGAYQDAITICLNQLQDVQMAILVCKLMENEKGKKALQEIYRRNFLQTSMITNDIWIRHIGYFLLGEYVESYNCLFIQSFDQLRISYETNYKICCETWKNEYSPELSVFHPSLVIFADKLKDSFRVKRQLQQYEEYHLRKTQGSNNIFDDFYGQSKKEQEVEIPQKSLKPNHKQLLLDSVQYYMKINMPYLATIIITKNYDEMKNQKRTIRKVWRKYIQRMFSIVLQTNNLTYPIQKIKELASLGSQQIPHYFQTQEVLFDYFENKLISVDSGEILLRFYIEMNNIKKIKIFCEKIIFQIKNYSLNRVTSFRVEMKYNYMILVHFIYWTQQTILLLKKKFDGVEYKSQIEREIKLQMRKIQIYLALMKLVITTRFGSYSNVQKLFQEIFALYQNFLRPQIDIPVTIFNKSRFEQIISKFPSRKFKFETSKTSKKMDILEESFRRAINDEKQYLQIPKESELLYWIFNLIIYQQIEQKLKLQYGIKSFLNSEKQFYKLKIECLIEKQKFQSILLEIKDLVKNGTFVWTKSNYLNSNTTLDKEQILLILNYLQTEKFLENKLSQIRMEKIQDYSPDSKKQVDQLKQNLFKNGIEIFKNKTEIAKSFIINNYEGYHNEMVILFKKSFRKLDIFPNIFNRNRSQDGSTLIDEDPIYSNNMEPNIEINNKMDFKSTLINSCATLLSSNINHKLQLFRPTKSIQLNLNNYLKSSDPAPTDTNELNSIISHRYLPLYMIGGKGGIDIYNYQTCKIFNKMTCPILTDIIQLKTDIINSMIGGYDSQGNLGIYKFDNTYNSNCLFSLKKANVNDFAFLNSNIIAVSSQKESLIQVFDPLMHPNRNTVFKDSISYVSQIQYSYDKNKFIAIRRAEVNVYDLRNGLTHRFDTGAQIKSVCMSTTSNKIIVGNINGQIKVYNFEGDEIVNLKSFKGSKKQISVQQIRISKQNAFALSSDGTISYVYHVL